MDSASLTTLPLPPANQLPLPGSEPKTIDARLNELLAIHKAFIYTALQHDEATAEYVDLKVQAMKGGRFVQTPAGGYQKNNRCISEAARELVMLGKTEDGRRKHIERALKVASLPAEVKAAAVAAGLDGKRSALVEIAKEPTVAAKLEKIGEIAKRKRAPRKEKTLEQALTAAPATSGGTDAQQMPADKNDAVPLLELLPTEYAGSIVPSGLNPDLDEGYSELMAAWLRASRSARERFIVFLQTEARANGD
jgi:hypothetical protein